MYVESHGRGSTWPWGISTLHEEARGVKRFAPCYTGIEERENRAPLCLLPWKASSPRPLDSKIWASTPVLPSAASWAFEHWGGCVLYDRDPITPVPYTIPQVTIYELSSPPSAQSAT